MIKHNEYLLYEVRDGCSEFRIQDGKLWMTVYGIPNFHTLPPGTYQLIGLGSELTEEQWREIVELMPFTRIKRWKEYDNVFLYHLSATHSGHSLLRSHNLKPETTIVLKTMLC